MKNRPPITRFTVLRNRGGVMLGMDLAGAFEEGVVYEIINVMDTFIIRPLGETAMPKDGSDGIIPNDNSTLSNILSNGSHLLTKEEKDRLVKG
jgi:hypothetical protein|tara:strand:- start:2576 stop:2854 length:279 start_codon:yes stop_codon:yes gene_type:complete